MGFGFRRPALKAKLASSLMYELCDVGQLIFSESQFHPLHHGKIPTHTEMVRSNNKIYSQRAWHSLGPKMVAIMIVWDGRRPEMGKGFYCLPVQILA